MIGDPDSTLYRRLAEISVEGTLVKKEVGSREKCTEKIELL